MPKRLDGKLTSELTSRYRESDASAKIGTKMYYAATKQDALQKEAHRL